MEMENLELKIAKFLRYGVIVAGVVIAVGWIMAFDPSQNPLTSLSTYSRIDLFTQLELAFMDQNFGKLISYIGLGILISLPVIRVVLSTFIFLKQKEFLMAGIGLAVMIGLLVSFSFGIEL